MHHKTDSSSEIDIFNGESEDVVDVYACSNAFYDPASSAIVGHDVVLNAALCQKNRLGYRGTLPDVEFYEPLSKFRGGFLDII